MIKYIVIVIGVIGLVIIFNQRKKVNQLEDERDHYQRNYQFLIGKDETYTKQLAVKLSFVADELSSSYRHRYDERGQLEYQVLCEMRDVIAYLNNRDEYFVKKENERLNKRIEQLESGEAVES